jgi:hypothetical protein
VRQLFVGAVMAMLCCGNADAENWSSVRCEDSRVVDAIKKTIATMKFEDGTPVGNYLGNNSKMTAKTVSAQRDRFICSVSVNVAYAGNTQSIRGKFIFREFSGKKISAQFVPF